MDPQIKYLLSLEAIRDRANTVWELAQKGELNHFDLHEGKLPEVADFVASTLKHHYGSEGLENVAHDSRWVHLEAGGVDRMSPLIKGWKQKGCDDLEVTRRLIDFFMISVLLDAGAGDHWRYRDSTGQTLERSEGLAVASLDMFNNFLFTSEQSGKLPIVNSKGLDSLKTNDLGKGLQVSESNPIIGLEPRAAILRKLGGSLLAHPEIFGPEGRPGNLVEYMLKNRDDSGKLELRALWEVLQSLFLPIWPKDRTVVKGIAIGDAWPLSTLRKGAQYKAGDDTTIIQPLHKLTQWVAYSLLVPFRKVLGMQWKNAELMTCLAEYRNGGVFVDLGALTLKGAALERGLKASGSDLPMFDGDDDVVVEWRALTVALLDKLHPLVSSRLGFKLAGPLLFRASWLSGRETAAERRPKTKSSPITIQTDGTLF